MPQQKYRSIKIREEDYLRIKKWAAVRDMKVYEIISYLVENEDKK